MTHIFSVVCYSAMWHKSSIFSCILPHEIYLWYSQVLCHMKYIFNIFRYSAKAHKIYLECCLVYCPVTHIFPAGAQNNNTCWGSVVHSHTTGVHTAQPHYRCAHCTATLQVCTLHIHTTGVHNAHPHYRCAHFTATLQVCKLHSHTTCVHTPH